MGVRHEGAPSRCWREWASATLIRVHFWCSAIGITIYFMALSVGGWFQGRLMNDPNVPFLQTVQYTVPFLWSRSVAGVLMAGGHVAFAVLFMMNLLQLGQERRGPTYFAERRQPGAPLATTPA